MEVKWKDFYYKQMIIKADLLVYWGPDCIIQTTGASADVCAAASSVGPMIHSVLLKECYVILGMKS